MLKYLPNHPLYVENVTENRYFNFYFYLFVSKVYILQTTRPYIEISNEKDDPCHTSPIEWNVFKKK